jgi:hypothetical protein
MALRLLIRDASGIVLNVRRVTDNAGASRKMPRIFKDL